MGNKILFFVILFLAFHGYSAAQTDIIQLKDSTIVKGKIIYNKPMTYVKIRNLDGKVMLYKYNVIESITEAVPDEVSNVGNRFVITKPFNKSTYHGVELRYMELGQIADILAHDNQSYLQFRRAITFHNFGAVLISAGSVASLIAQNQFYDGEITDYKNTLAIAIGCSVSGLTFSIVGLNAKRKSIRSFNNHP